MKNSKPLLAIDRLKACFDLPEGRVRAVEDLSLTLNRGETLALVGESGCGKTACALSVMRLLPAPAGRILGGRILLEGRDLLKVSEREMQKIRGNRISMVFQEPMTSLNPVMAVGKQIGEVLRVHGNPGRAAARAAAKEMIEQVGIPDVTRSYDAFPHEISGGMKQRIMIAMALICRPEVLIADEPTTAVDVTVQAQLLRLLKSLQNAYGLAILLITHDLSVVSEMADRVAVMYAAKIVERSPRAALLKDPRHPYTRGLFQSLPRMGSDRPGRLVEIPGSVPDALRFPKGCRFHPRCPRVKARCEEEEPLLRELEPGREAACHYPY
jgi:oligopeptide/dipeptide ABC transporter ATP-binding protein